MPTELSTDSVAAAPEVAEPIGDGVVRAARIKPEPGGAAHAGGERNKKHLKSEPAGGYAFADVVSGQFDADVAEPQEMTPKRVLLPQAETPKLHKVLAQAGLGSRLEMEQLILELSLIHISEPTRPY